VSRINTKSQSLDIVRALIQGNHTVQTKVQAKVQHEQKWTRKSAISVLAAKIAGTILLSTEPAISNIAVVEPPLFIHDIQPQDPQLLRAVYTHLLEILTFQCTQHPIVEPGPQQQLPQVEPILTQADTVQKVLAIGRGKAWAARVSEYIMQGNFFDLLQVENGSRTCGTSLVVS
jgi:hypothetical protein